MSIGFITVCYFSAKLAHMLVNDTMVLKNKDNWILRVNGFTVFGMCKKAGKCTLGNEYLTLHRDTEFTGITIFEVSFLKHESGSLHVSVGTRGIKVWGWWK